MPNERPTVAQLKDARKKFLIQKNKAGRRGIAFNLSFDQWLNIWMQSGHWLERGCCKGQYVMARPHDQGPYSVNNVEIVKCEANHQDAAPQMRGLVRTAEHKHNLSLAHRGKRLSKAHKQAIGNGVRGKMAGVPKSAEHRHKLSLAMRGKSRPPFTASHRRKLSIAAHKREQQRREANYA